MHTIHPTFRIGIIVFFIFSTLSVQAQLFNWGKKDKQKKSQKKKKKQEAKPIQKVTKNCKKYSGLFTLYQDTTNGSVYLQVEEQKLGQKYIYFSHVMNALLSAGYWKGQYRQSRVFKINKYYNRLEFTLENTNYYFDKDNALYKAKDANINEPVIISKKIVGINESKDTFLLKAKDIFLSENFQRIKRSRKQLLGKLNRKKTHYQKIKNYPKNTDVLVRYVYQKKFPKRGGGGPLTDPRFITLNIRHSLVKVPEDNGFEPRPADPRIGYFTNRITNMTTLDPTPYKDVITRWKLEKKHPDQKLSEPVKPITWWVGKATPKPFRETVKKAILKWNEAFRQIGFKNAVRAKVQPDTADWDAGDLRYNVIRWTSSPRPPFGGYGPHVAHPRTGQVLGSDIMIEFVSISGRYQQAEVFRSAALDMYYLNQDSLNRTPGYCSYSRQVHQQVLYGLTLLQADQLKNISKEKFIKQNLYRLVLHEVGHTLGLTHNFKASAMQDFKQIHNEEHTQQEGLTGSVMDYPAVNFATAEYTQGQFYDTKPGPYDKWAIKYGYSPGYEEPKKEAKRLDSILQQSTKPELAYANDADDMRAPGKGIDPLAMVDDMSDQPIEYAKDRMNLIHGIMDTLRQKFSIEGQSYHELWISFLFATGNYAEQLEVASRYIGGVYVDRAFVGQPGGGEPYTPVSLEKQEKAMQVLHEYAFRPGAFQIPGELIQHLQEQRRGFSFFGRTEDPKIHERILLIQSLVLDHILHHRVLRRLTNTSLYGNEYEVSEFMTDLTHDIIREDLQQSVSPIRQNLQAEYVDRLIKILGVNHQDTPYDHISRATALSELRRIQQMMENGRNPDEATRMHREHLIFKIEQALAVNKTNE